MGEEGGGGVGDRAGACAGANVGAGVSVVAGVEVGVRGLNFGRVCTLGGLANLLFFDRLIVMKSSFGRAA